MIGVFKQRWTEPGGEVTVYLHGVDDPGNVGTIIRSAHAFADGPVIIGPGCADPYSPKAVRASMGSIFARPPARAAFDDLPGTRIAYVMEARDPEPVDPPVVVCIGGERFGLDEVADRAELRVRIPMRADAPDSLNAAMAATVALYEQLGCPPWLIWTRCAPKPRRRSPARRARPSSRNCAFATSAASPS